MRGDGGDGWGWSGMVRDVTDRQSAYELLTDVVGSDVTELVRGDDWTPLDPRGHFPFREISTEI